MSQNQNKMHMQRGKLVLIRDWIMDHSKIVMPLVLVICVVITVIIAVNANHREALEAEAQQAAAETADTESGDTQEGQEALNYELEEDAHPEINNLVRTYYDAHASGDIETIASLNSYLNEIDMIKIQEQSKYIESYPEIKVYTKPGLSENTYVAYVCSMVKFKDEETPIPGFQTYYVGLSPDGKYFMNIGTYDEEIWDYITDVTLQDDVVDLNNKVAVEFRELLAENKELEEFVAYLKDKINEDVGNILAEAEAPAPVVEEPEEPEKENTVDTENHKVTVRTTEVVNIRSSDSEEADKLDKAQVGQKFVLLEQKGNGWSKVAYGNGEAYIKSDYLEIDSEEPAEPANGADTQTTQQETNSDKVSGTVTVKESVRVRAAASTDSEILGKVYAGDKLELIMKQADGWSKIKYKGKTAYVKSEYVE